MAISLVQGPTYGSGTGTATASFTNTPTEGNLLVVLIRTGEVNFNNTTVAGFTKAVETLTDTARALAIFYKTAGASESKDVVGSCAGIGMRLVIQEWSGLVGPILDKVADVDDTGSAVTSRSSGTTATITKSEELLISGQSPAGLTSGESLSNSFTLSYGTNAMFMGYRVAAAAATYETTLSWTTSRQCGGCIATFMVGTALRANYLHARRDRMNTKGVSKQNSLA